MINVFITDSERSAGMNYDNLHELINRYEASTQFVNASDLLDISQRKEPDEDPLEKLITCRVLILDDVISTGESLTALEKLVEKAGGIIAAKAAVLAEGNAADRSDIVFLEKLPLFPHD